MLVELHIIILTITFSCALYILLSDMISRNVIDILFYASRTALVMCLIYFGYMITNCLFITLDEYHNNRKMVTRLINKGLILEDVQDIIYQIELETLFNDLIEEERSRLKFENSIRGV